MVTDKQQRRIYHLQYQLKRRRNTVRRKEKMVVKRAIDITPIETAWLAELVNVGYGVCDDLFASLDQVKAINL